MLSLSHFVEDVRSLTFDGRLRHLEHIPDGRTYLVVRSIEGEGDVTVLGPRTRAHFKRVSGVQRAVMLQFKPGWSCALLGVAANELTDRHVALEDLWGRPGRDLRLELLAAGSTRELLDLVSSSLVGRAEQTVEPEAARLARRAVRLLEGGETRIDRVASLLGVTTRHLRRAFTENIGIGPKDFARTVRLRRAVRMAERSTDWVRIASDAGYYDQAHLIAEFRELIGLTPGAFLKRARDPVEVPAAPLRRFG